jgi:hypothetical protein
MSDAAARITAGASSAGPSSRDSTDELERIVLRFEDAWRRGERPSIADYLPVEEQGDSGPRPTLIELVHVDLERRLKRGEPRRVEEYVSAWPMLAEDPSVLLELIVEECRLRARLDTHLTLAEYRARFPQFGDHLSERLPWATR